MGTTDITATRLRNQRIAAPGCVTPLEAVETLGAMQGQDYPGLLWSIGLRMPAATVTDVERAFADREIVRTWPMRGTLHVIPGTDARWMLELLTPRVIVSTVRRRAQLGLDDATFARAAQLFTEALRGGNRLTREAMLALLESHHISAAGGRGYHILFHLSMHRLICFGPAEGKQHTFVLFDEWLPDAKGLDRDESLAVLARRYFTGHGPATPHDFAWWSGLTVADARAGLDANSDLLTSETVEGTTYWLPRYPPATPLAASSVSAVHLLPGFDEYLLGYRDRSAALHADHSERIVPGGNGVFKPTVVIGGQVAGVWKRVTKKGATTVDAAPFWSFSSAERRGIEAEARRYREFLMEP